MILRPLYKIGIRTIPVRVISQLNSDSANDLNGWNGLNSWNVFESTWLTPP
jgi:hypothetical protein